MTNEENEIVLISDNESIKPEKKRQRTVPEIYFKRTRKDQDPIVLLSD